MKLRNPVRIGDHEVEIGGNLVRVIFRGDFTAEHARRYAALVDASIPRDSLHAVLAQITELGRIHPETRRFLVGWNQSRDLGFCAVFGASRMMRGALTLAVRALTLTKGTPFPVHFYADEAAAEAAIAARK